MIYKPGNQHQVRPRVSGVWIARRTSISAKEKPVFSVNSDLATKERPANLPRVVHVQCS